MQNSKSEPFQIDQKQQFFSQLDFRNANKVRSHHQLLILLSSLSMPLLKTLN